MTVRIKLTVGEFHLLLEKLQCDFVFQSDFHEIVVKTVLKQFFIKLLKRQFTLKTTGNSISINQLEAIALNEVILQNIQNPLDFALSNDIKEKTKVLWMGTHF